MHYISIVLFILFALLQVADLSLTWRIITAGGRELNPVMKFVIDRLGLIPGLCLFKGVMLLFAGLFLLGHPIIMLALVIAYVVVVTHNLHQLPAGGKA